MLKNILHILLLSSTLFSYEIQLIKPSTTDTKISKPKVHETALYRDDSKELVIDKNTGLMWQDSIETKTLRKSRIDAKQYCRRLVFAGFKDWYLPRLKELNSIVDKKNYNPAIRDGFKNITPNHYWTSSPHSNTTNVLNIDFKSGTAYYNSKKGKCYIRCVRGNYNTFI